MHIDIAVIGKGRGNGECCADRATEAVDKHIHAFVLVLAKNKINIGAVEVIASDNSFKM